MFGYLVEGIFNSLHPKTGDLNMAEGIEHNEIIKIGFLNYTENDEKYNDFIKPYLYGYDVIITEDSDINLLNNVLKTL